MTSWLKIGFRGRKAPAVVAGAVCVEPSFMRGKSQPRISFPAPAGG